MFYQAIVSYQGFHIIFFRNHFVHFWVDRRLFDVSSVWLLVKTKLGKGVMSEIIRFDFP